MRDCHVGPARRRPPRNDNVMLKSQKILLSDFDYHLPTELIGQKPIKPRDHARLLVLDRRTGETSHRHFYDLPGILRPGDVLVFNDSKVIPARIRGTKETGGQVEIFLLKKSDVIAREAGGRPRQARGRQENTWQCLIGGKVKSGQKIRLPKGVEAEIMGSADNKVKTVRFNCSEKKLLTLGETPLPPYIKSKSRPGDYQTVYADKQGSVAAPTAGLHFTKPLLAKLRKLGVQTEFVTLHVGMGTFEPVETENVLEHKMHSELAMIDGATAVRINKAKSEGRRIIAVGTTAVRTLESFASSGELESGSKWTEIFIYPGYKFKVIDGMITNFHLPKSTLLMLVSAFAGKELTAKAYGEAIGLEYKFFSFGDGMIVE